MERLQNSNNEKSNSNLYPQAKYQDNKFQNYSNTNNYTYSKMTLNSRLLENSDTLIDPITREISNNITYNFNSRVEKANKLNSALKIIKDSIIDEDEDINFYTLIKNQAQNSEDKEIINDIINDEKKHNMILKQIYFSLTGTNVSNSNDNIKVNDINKNTYMENLKNALFGELNATKKYREILSAMNDKDNYNKIMEIMIDEITHADKFNYLITKSMLNN